jgi:hypothetical protein
MADLSCDFVGIKSPNPFWLASAPPTDKEYNVRARLRGGLGRRRVEDARDGPADRQRERPALWRGLGGRPAAARPQQHRADHRPAARREPARDQGGEAGLSRPGDGRVADGAVRGGAVEGDPPLVEETGRRGRAQLRLPARDERARHGLGRGAGARIHRDGGALVQAAHAHAGDREADPEHHRHPLSGAGGEARRGGCGPSSTR